MLKEEEMAEVRRLRLVEHLSIRAIAKKMNRHYSAIQRALSSNNIGRIQSKEESQLDSLLMPMLPFIESKLEAYPNLVRTRLCAMLKDKGIDVSVHQLRRFLRKHHIKKNRRAFMKVSLIQGEQAQVDWAHCGEIVIDGAKRKLSLFVMVLSYSRMIFARFYVDQCMASFLSAHLRAIRFFGGVPDKLLYDNLKTAVVSHVGPVIRFSPELMRLASQLHCTLDACNPRSGWEKGRVERAIRYLKESFLLDRTFTDLSHANREVIQWLNDVGNKRPWVGGTDRSVEAVWREVEQKSLRSESISDKPIYHEVSARVGKTPYVRFDCNDYSVPHRFVNEVVVIFATEELVKICHGTEEISCHKRSYSRGKTIELKEHIEELIRNRSAAIAQTRRRLFHTGLPSAANLIEKIAEGHGSINQAKKHLFRLMESYSISDVDGAIAQALDQGTYSIAAVELILRHQVDESKELDLSSYPDFKYHHVKSHDLSEYDFSEKDPL